MPFRALNLSPQILLAVRDAGYTEPTPIQIAAIPHILAGHDVIGIAQTGTGKTAAFALPILQRLSSTPRNGNKARALILCPTRELATQISDDFRARYLANPDDPEAFAWLERYSPYHHVEDGVAYPALLLLTAESDSGAEVVREPVEVAP